MLPILIRVFGILGLTLTATSFQMNTRRGILGFQIASNTSFLLQFTLLGAPTGAILNLIGAIRPMLYLTKGKTKLTSTYFLPGLFITFQILTGLLTYFTAEDKSVLPLIPAFASCLQSIAMWQNEPKRTRSIGIVASPFWLVYNFLTGSYEGALTELFCMTSIVVGMFRFDFRKLPEEADTNTSEASLSEDTETKE